MDDGHQPIQLSPTITQKVIIIGAHDMIAKCMDVTLNSNDGDGDDGDGDGDGDGDDGDGDGEVDGDETI